MKKLILVFAAIALSGCVMMSSKSVSYVSPGGQKISAEATGMGFVHLTIPEDLDVADQLRQKCPGTVSGVETTLTMRDFFVVQMFTLKATGHCKK